MEAINVGRSLRHNGKIILLKMNCIEMFCLFRHNAYLQECTGVRDPSYPYTIQDIKLLLLRFAHEKSFSEDSGGGGRQSNMHLIPYLMHMALYVINT